MNIIVLCCVFIPCLLSAYCIPWLVLLGCCSSKELALLGIKDSNEDDSREGSVGVCVTGDYHSVFVECAFENLFYVTLLSTQFR